MKVVVWVVDERALVVEVNWGKVLYVDDEVMVVIWEVVVA